MWAEAERELLCARRIMLGGKLGGGDETESVGMAKFLAASEASKALYSSPLQA